MASYKGQTRTPYTNALEAAKKAAEQAQAVEVPDEQPQVLPEVETPKKGKRKA